MTVTTGDIRGGGTSANVECVVYGANGDSGVRKLDASGSPFSRGTTTDFGFSCVALGDIDRLRIWHDNSGLFGAGW